MRGYDPYLVTRVQRAEGDRHYFDPDTLRWFDAYCGATFAPRGVYPHVRVIVESVRDTAGHAYGGQRRYRAVVVTFYLSDPEPSAHTSYSVRRETVSVDRTGVDYATAGAARRDARELTRDISQALPHGLDALDATHARDIATIVTAGAA